MVHGELWGITAEGWVAIATLAGGIAVLIGIVISTRQFLTEQEAQDVRRYLVEQGAWKLKASVDRLIQIVTMNHGTAMHQVRLLRDLAVGQPGAPSPDDLPRLLPFSPDEFALDAIRPASRVLNCEELGPVATSAFARLYNVNTTMLAEVEQSVRTYYSGKTPLSDDERKELAERLFTLTDREAKRAWEFLKLPAWLEDAGLRIQELRIKRFSDIDRLHKDKTIRNLASNVRDFLKEFDRKDEAEGT